MPDSNQTLIIRVLLFIFVMMFIANTIAQFLQINYKEPFYLATWLMPMLGVVVYAYYRHQKNNLQNLLIVEDEDIWVIILNTCLQNRFNIKTCRSGEEALLYLKNCGPGDMPTKAPETFQGPGGLYKALEDKPTNVFKNLLMFKK